MRRLPVYIVLDISGSMNGEPIEAVRQGMQVLVENLRQDPYALETAWISVITFSEEAQQVVPLTELVRFSPPDLRVGGRTALGAALALLVDRMGVEVQKSSGTRRGDWKPMVFVMSDGVPTDDIEEGVRRLKQADAGVVVCCAAGPHSSTEALGRICENVVKLDAADFPYIKAFFKWVSSSISSCSRRVEGLAKEASGLSDLPAPPSDWGTPSGSMLDKK